MIRRSREWWLAKAKAEGNATVLAGRVDREHGLAYIEVWTAPIASTLVASDHVLLDLDAEGFLVGVELLRASNHVGPDRVLVCGGRDYADRQFMSDILDAINPGTIGHGAAPGADTMAAAWGHSRGVPVIPYPALWRRFGRAAGPMRNRSMLDDFRPFLVLAFPGGRGTADMVKVARQRRTHVVLVPRR